MNDERAKEIKAIKAAYDVSTLMRVLPWIFLMQDQRGPAILTKIAFEETKGFLESNINDASRSRQSLMRGLMINWFQAMGLRLDPNAMLLLQLGMS